MEDSIVVIFLCALCFFYPYVHNFFRFIGELLFQKNKNILLNYIRLINIIYFPICLVVFYMYSFGEFSIFSGWDIFQTAVDEDAEFLSKRRGFLAGILIAVVPFLLFFSSITYGFMSYQRIKNPENLLDKDYD